MKTTVNNEFIVTFDNNEGEVDGLIELLQDYAKQRNKPGFKHRLSEKADEVVSMMIQGLIDTGFIELPENDKEQTK